MHNKSRATTAAALAAIVALSGCGNSDSNDANSTPTAQTAQTAVDTATQDSHNQADVDFAQGMIPHHEQAVEMSDILLAKPDIDPRVAQLAEEIKAAQAPEIEQLQGWLTQWGAPAASDHGMEGMHGMMSEQDIAELRDAQGTEASRLFLTQMIEHHDGAVIMAQTEIDSGQFSDAVAMARDIISTQQQEIDHMREILQSL
ncbi:DUF305 domain-containing protein [[Mycobacterium] burgundiense]|uniref:DUF305 domain-containing protein n=1 Tax=[Mycobacterium] burgundiense TaxID=3064286 RepID=A0ABM9LVM2_9MYCO|nr:DUF305 domain-containing protein [Mycolicibacterium sp. MU0053]CAJ1505483.1 DUF305 domain-containing protein [Mycolicibacterium sp. MU0053]